MLKHDKCQPFEDEIARLKEENKKLVLELLIARSILFQAGLIGAVDDIDNALAKHDKN